MTVIRRTTVSVDVTKINKEKIREYARKDGTVAKFLSLDIIETDKQTVEKKADGTPIGGGGRVKTNIGFVVQSKNSKDEENGDIIGNAFEWKEQETDGVDAQNDEVDSPF